jgi:hypothetical protein
VDGWSLASGLTVRHLTLDQGIEGSNPSSPANSFSQSDRFEVPCGTSRQLAARSVDAVVDAIGPRENYSANPAVEGHGVAAADRGGVLNVDGVR